MRQWCAGSCKSKHEACFHACGCRTLFCQPCAATGKLLALDPGSNELLPPIVRPMRGATRRQLLAAARSPSECAAYMPHAVPPALL